MIVKSSEGSFIVWEDATFTVYKQTLAGQAGHSLAPAPYITTILIAYTTVHMHLTHQVAGGWVFRFVRAWSERGAGERRGSRVSPMSTVRMMSHSCMPQGHAYTVSLIFLTHGVLPMDFATQWSAAMRTPSGS